MNEISSEIMVFYLNVLHLSEETPRSKSVAMPKKKTGARKKAEKQRARQKDIRASKEHKSIVEKPCNFIMVGFIP